MFGRVIDGMLTLRKIENVATGANNRPKLAVKIVGMCSLIRWTSAPELTDWFAPQNAVKCNGAKVLKM